MYTMKEVCQKVNFSYDTLKYYCNQGLIPHVKRDKNNYRIFDDKDINWINNLICLKNCGMSIQDIKQYLQLCLQGESSIPQRIDVLDIQKEILLKKIEELNQSIAYIDSKQEFYHDVLDGKVEFYSDLVQCNTQDPFQKD